jgi:protein-disulfide isomerase
VTTFFSSLAYVTKVTTVAATLIAFSPAEFSSVFAQEISPEISSERRIAFENIIRDYLMKNPIVISEAMQVLQQREEAERQASSARALKDQRTELLHDPSSPVGGNPRGDITIVEFFDYNCGYCKNVTQVVNATLKSHPNVRMVYKEFAILGPESILAARAALAAGRQGKYLEFHDAMMSAERADANTVSVLSQALGLDEAKLLKDMQDPEITEILERNYQLAEMLGINGTPAFVIGERLIPGAVDEAALADIIATEREKMKASEDKAEH